MAVETLAEGAAGHDEGAAEQPGVGLESRPSHTFRAAESAARTASGSDPASETTQMLATEKMACSATSVQSGVVPDEMKLKGVSMVGATELVVRQLRHSCGDGNCTCVAALEGLDLT